MSEDGGFTRDAERRTPALSRRATGIISLVLAALTVACAAVVRLGQRR
jgi:hypothetical protein